MVDRARYVPILKLKKGELSALADVKAVHDQLTPLFDITPPKKARRGKTQKTAVEQAASVAARIMDSWRSTSPVFLDAQALDDPGELGFSGALGFIASEARRTDFNFVPVTGLRRSRAYQQGVRSALEQKRQGICLRVEVRDVDAPNFSDALESLLGHIGISATSCDFLLDLQHIPEGQAGTYSRAVLDILPALPHLAEWRSLIIAGASYPETLGDLGRNSLSRLYRQEWLMYKRLADRRQDLPRFPIYSDYGVTHPGMDAFLAAAPKITPAIRYTAGDKFVIARGEHRSDENFEQYRELANILVRLPEFEDSDGFADQYIRTYAAGAGEGTGTPTTWVRVGTVRHFEQVLAQLASLTSS